MARLEDPATWERDRVHIKYIKGAGLVRPEYVFRPSQYVRRFSRLGTIPERATTPLPWGDEIEFRPSDTIGEQLWRVGVFELANCEVLWRLTDPGAHVLDIGANIGQMSSLLSRRVGPDGSVNSFEPHPTVFSALESNLNRWNSTGPRGQITTHSIALSTSDGEMALHLPPDFDRNHGLASLESSVDPGSDGSTVNVETRRLDGMLDDLPEISLVKIDVEGHELGVFRGAQRFFDTHPVTDVIFEDHAEFPSPAAEFLLANGYTIYGIDKRWRGLTTFDPTDRPEGSWSFDFVATRDPDRCVARLGRPGWSVLRA